MPDAVPTHERRPLRELESHAPFVDRHIGPRESDVEQMLAQLGYDSLNGLVDAAVPEDIRWTDRLELPAAVSEPEVLRELHAIADWMEGKTAAG